MKDIKTALSDAMPTQDPAVQAMMQEIAKLKADNAKLKAVHDGRRLTIKVSQKGAVSIYGLGRFPVTLYKEQWQKLIAETENITKFIAENDSLLLSKADKAAKVEVEPVKAA